MDLPTLTELRYPAPSDWREFELMMCDLFGKIWGDPHPQRNGRPGQRQYGVDIFGRSCDRRGYEGVQCKCADSLSERDIRKAYWDSTRFELRLTRFFIATTARRDARAQRIGRVLTEEGPYPCDIWSWEDICEKLCNYGELVRKYYGDLLIKAVGDSPGTLITVNTGSTRYELLISKMPDKDEYYGGTILVSDLANRRCQIYRIGDHWSRLHGFVGYGPYDAFVVSTWLNSVQSVDELLEAGRTQCEVRLTAQQQEEFLSHLAGLKGV